MYCTNDIIKKCLLPFDMYFLLLLLLLQRGIIDRIRREKKENLRFYLDFLSFFALFSSLLFIPRTFLTHVVAIEHNLCIFFRIFFFEGFHSLANLFPFPNTNTHTNNIVVYFPHFLNCCCWCCTRLHFYYLILFDSRIEYKKERRATNEGKNNITNERYR